jgi:hypothetical protein
MSFLAGGHLYQRPLSGVARKCYNATMTTITKWKYLVRKPGSNYKQLFIKDRWIAARTIFGQTLGEDARTPVQLAVDFDLSLDAVLEAIAYCESNPPEIQEDWQREQDLAHATGMDDPSYKFHGKPLLLSPQERARLGRQ